MRIQRCFLIPAVSVALAFSCHASLIGSSYVGTVSTSASDLSVSPAGANSYTDLTNPLTFCVNSQSESGCALSGSFFFTDVDATHADLTFDFSGSVSAAAGDTFTIDLGDVVALDGTQIGGIDQTASSLADGTFQLTSFDGADALFTGAIGSDGSLSAGAGQAIVFGDILATPEPASVLLSAGGLPALILLTRRLRARQARV